MVKITRDEYWITGFEIQKDEIKRVEMSFLQNADIF